MTNTNNAHNNAHNAGFEAAQRMLKQDDTGEREAIEQALAWNDTRIDAIRERAELTSERADEWGDMPEDDDACDAWLEGWEAGFVAWFSEDSNPEPEPTEARVTLTTAQAQVAIEALEHWAESIRDTTGDMDEDEREAAMEEHERAMAAMKAIATALGRS